jgi:hypothetical protein
VRELQAQYLCSLMDQSDLTVEEIATASWIIAFFHERPDAAFSPNSFRDWLRGIHEPTTAHRFALAQIFHVSFDDLNDGIDGPFDWEAARSILTSVIAIVRGKHRHFVYHLSILNRTTDLSRPAIYFHWADMFGPWPASLSCHFHHLQHPMYGWIPETNAGPIRRYSGSLVALKVPSASRPIADSSDATLWFAKVGEPEATVQVGYREDRSLMLSDPTQSRCDFDQTELLGYASDEPLLTLQPFSVERLQALAAFHQNPIPKSRPNI